MGRYEYWVDGYDKEHFLTEMKECHINNCLQQLKKWAKKYRNKTIDNLTTREKQDPEDVGKPYWYILHGENYTKAFNDELARRKNE